MGVVGEGVGTEFERLWFAPRSVGTCRSPNFGHAWIFGMGGADGEVHRLPIGRKGRCAFVVVRTEGLYEFGRFPSAFLVLAHHEEVTGLLPRDARKRVAGRCAAIGGEVELLFLVRAEESRRVVGTVAVEVAGEAHGVERTGIACGDRVLRALQSDGRCRVVGLLEDVLSKCLFRPFVVAFEERHLADAQIGERVDIFVALRRAVGAEGARGVAVAAVGFAHKEGQPSALLLLFDGSEAIGFLIERGRFGIFADGHGTFGTACTSFGGGAGGQ